MAIKSAIDYHIVLCYLERVSLY